MSKEQKPKGKLYIDISYVKRLMVTHPDTDHQLRFLRFESQHYMPESLANSLQARQQDAAPDVVFVDKHHGSTHFVELKGTSAKNRGARLTAAEPDFSLPAAAQFVLAMMSRERRDDVRNDIADWLPGWIREHGMSSAYVLCWFKIVAAVFGGLLDLSLRVGDILGKFRGAR